MAHNIRLNAIKTKNEKKKRNNINIFVPDMGGMVLP